MLVDERMCNRSQQLQQLRDNLEVVFEPVERWQNIKSEHGNQPINILDLFYSSPERYAYTFQNFVFLTRMVQVLWCEEGFAHTQSHTHTYTHTHTPKTSNTYTHTHTLSHTHIHTLTLTLTYPGA